MRLFFKKIHKWPKLVWVASFVEGLEEITGPFVETNKDWCAETVWADDYKKGDFDRTDLIFGSGIRCRNETVMFVSSGTVLDRLFYSKVGDIWYLSNSLPGLLACAKISLKTNYLDYHNDIRSIEKGLKKYQRVLPGFPENINLISFNNLLYDGNCLKELDKPDTAPNFDTFKTYLNFLINSANRLQQNFNDPARKNTIRPLACLSSGYDSPTTAIIVKYAGCKETVTIKDTASILKTSDSGFDIAKTLKMKCKTYKRAPDRYKNEIAFWAAAGVDLDLNLSVFDYPAPLCLFFTGFNGDRLWNRQPHSV